eukprot:TRINITY_DN11801_c0_g1_i1.p1 TRINITY_DN11801_c0_g1~~TRINITY_DN11801_c0_g1_i1.p1  ORF type:complete len:260 (+),score=54.46 TRINITY_DN11801_c0_g1_i1:100-879(+)
MTSIGTGYDLSATTYSPDGRVFQVEYAQKAVENSGTAIGLRVKDGVVLGVEKLVISKMLEPGSNRRIHSVDRHIGLATAGFMADGSQILNWARKEAREYKSFYSNPISTRVLCDRLSGFVQMYTLYASIRPFGCSALLAGVDRKVPQLFCIEPSGVSWGYFGCSIGKGKQAARTEIEKLNLSQMTCREAVIAIAKIIYAGHDEVKDKEFELELSWVCEESKYEHAIVPKDLRLQAEKLAQAALEEEDESDEEDEMQGDT